MRAWWLILLVAAGAVAQEGEGAPGKGEDAAAGLKSADAATRAKAIRALGRDRDARAPAAARAALDDPDSRVRAAAASTLVRVAGPDDHAIEVLVASLRDPDWYTRWDAAVAIGSLGPEAEAAAPALLAAATEKDLDIAREAVNAALRVAPKLDEEVVAGLVRVLESDAAINRRVILRALGDGGMLTPAKEWLAREVLSDRHGLRPEAVGFLAKSGTLLGLGSREVGTAFKRGDVVVGLGADKEIGTALFVELLRDADADVRRAATYALSKREATETAPAVAKLLEDGSSGVRLSAARALLCLNTPVPEAGPSLVRLMAEGDGMLASAAHGAMEVTGFTALAAFLEYGTSVDKGTRAWLLRLHPQANVEDRDVRLGKLIETLEDEHHGAALVAVLREKLAEDEDQILLDALGSSEATVRHAAAALLGHLARDRKAASAALRIAAHDENEDVRAAAKKALERLGTK